MDSELVESINRLSSSLERGTASEDEQERFLSLVQEQPQLLTFENSSVSSSLLAILISIISMKTKTSLVINAIKLLHGYL